jgi:hypothetical protein
MSAGEPAGVPNPGTLADLGAEADGTEVSSLDTLPIVADPALAGLAATYQTSHAFDGVDSGYADTHLYDGHVALALDPSLLPAMDSMLDLLMSSHDLFDVPAMDIAGVPASDDATST